MFCVSIKLSSGSVEEREMSENKLTGEHFHNFLEFSQTHKIASITRSKHKEHVFHLS